MKEYGWGCDVRSGEHLIGKDNGVFRVATVRRKTADGAWSRDRLKSMKGTPKAPVPGQSYNRSPAFSKRFGLPASRDEPFVPQPAPVATAIRNWNMFKRDIDAHGPTDGCAACKLISRGASYHAPHSLHCRKYFRNY